LATPFGE
jgi:acetyl esterase/lipase